MLARASRIRTIVRFCLVAAGLTGCSAAPRLDRAALACDEGLPPLCTTFATDARCSCLPRPELERFLGGFGSAAWPGAID
jgi:hypothetical protein